VSRGSPAPSPVLRHPSLSLLPRHTFLLLPPTSCISLAASEVMLFCLPLPLTHCECVCYVWVYVWCGVSYACVLCCMICITSICLAVYHLSVPCAVSYLLYLCVLCCTPYRCCVVVYQSSGAGSEREGARTVGERDADRGRSGSGGGFSDIRSAFLLSLSLSLSLSLYLPPPSSCGIACVGMARERSNRKRQQKEAIERGNRQRQ